MGETSRVALLAGASGLVGGHLVEALIDAPDFTRIYAVTRRPLGREHVRLANRIVQFDKLETQLKGIACDVAFCCLGTTLQQAGSEKAHRQVDVDYVLAFARAAKSAQAQRFVMVSAAGASATSDKLFLRVKGEIEDALAGLGFTSLDIMQPGVVLGRGRQMGPLALLGRALMPIANPFLTGERERHRGIPARTVAAAMLGAARSGRRGVYRYTFAGMRTLAQSRVKATASLSPQ